MVLFLTKVLIVYFILLTSSSVLFQFVTSSDDFSCKSNLVEGSCTKQKKYFLYDVNPGEGFNLRRDIYIRIAPLIASLNYLDKQNQWILVLPPWGRIPHWRSTSPEYYPWSTFFNLEEILQYIPALELYQFLEEFGQDTKISRVFQLQHFPFDPNDRTWSEKIEKNNPCEDNFPYHWHQDSSDYSGPFWNEPLRALNASCMSLRGQASSTLAPFLLGSNYSSVMFDRAEVILWDDYGGSSWWRARVSLRFATHLNQVAAKYVASVSLRSDLVEFGTGIRYVGVHLRRRDFVFGRRRLSLPSVQGAAKQVFQIAKRLKLQGVFLASDATADEFEDFWLAFKILKEDHESGIILMSLHESADLLQQMDQTLVSTVNKLSEGQRSILDQIVCANASYFIGTPDSTFTLRIFEEREILGFDSDSTFNYLCPDILEEEDVFTEIVDCKQPTKWKLKN